MHTMESKDYYVNVIPTPGVFRWKVKGSNREICEQIFSITRLMLVYIDNYVYLSQFRELFSLYIILFLVPVLNITC